MAARGKRRRELGKPIRSEPCGYPYWVEYLERGSNVDFRAVDAVSGKRAGAAVRGAIARGIAADNPLTETRHRRPAQSGQEGSAPRRL